MNNRRAKKIGIFLGVLMLALTLNARAAVAFTGVPKLTIIVPTLKFTDLVTKTEGDATYLYIPWLGQYIAALYKYSLGIAVVVATVMIVIGGFQYLTGGGDAGRVKAGKDRITNAVVGLLLLFGSYIMLTTIDPDLVEFKTLKLTQLKRVPYAPGPWLAVTSPEALEAAKEQGGKLLETTPADETALPPEMLQVPPASSCKNKQIDQKVRDLFMKHSAKTGVPAATALAQWAVESGYGGSCIGPPDKKFNCGGIKCFSGGKYAGMETLVEQGKPDCPADCIGVKTKERRKGTPPSPPTYDDYYACFQIIDNFDAYLDKHAHVVKKKNWEKYKDNPKGFADWVESWGYATAPGYAAVLKNIMKIHCLIPPPKE